MIEWYTIWKYEGLFKQANLVDAGNDGKFLKLSIPIYE